MRKILPCALTVFLLSLLAGGCGSETENDMLEAGTAATLQTGDALNDQIVKFELTITSITLTGTAGTSNTANLLRRAGEVEFTHQAGTFQPLSLVRIPPGTYSGATMTVSNPEVVAIIGGVPAKLTASLSSATVTIPFNPSITVGTSPLLINLNIDLPNSITITSSNATVAPTFKVSTSTVADQNNQDDSDGGIEDAHGIVSDITAPNFTIQTESARFVFATDSNTVFQAGLSQLSDLTIGEILEVDGVTRSDGTRLATTVSLESNSNGEEVEGIISALDSPLTTITVVHQLDSTGASSEPVTVNVTVNANTVFSVRPDRLNVTAAAFDASHIGKGQRIEVEAANNTSPFVATRIELREQALLGTVAASPAPTSAGFTLNVSPASAFATLSGGVTSIPVTFASGANLKATATAGGNIRVRGLVFVNGGAYSMVAVLDDDNN